MFQRLQFWKKYCNLEPKIIYDIGAHEGYWTKECLKVFPAAKIYQFEADLDKRRFLSDPRIDSCKGKEAYFEVLGEEDGKLVTFYKTKHVCTTGNSIMKENTGFFQDCLEEKRNMKTLATLVKEKKIPPPDFLKIDTQGSELSILKGAGKDVLEHVDLILLETSLQEYNQGVPLFDKDLIPFMNNLGYRMIDIVELHYVSYILIQMDVLFCKQDDVRFFPRKF